MKDFTIINHRFSSLDSSIYNEIKIRYGTGRNG